MSKPKPIYETPWMEDNGDDFLLTIGEFTTSVCGDELHRRWRLPIPRDGNNESWIKLAVFTGRVSQSVKITGRGEHRFHQVENEEVFFWPGVARKLDSLFKRHVARTLYAKCYLEA